MVSGLAARRIPGGELLPSVGSRSGSGLRVLYVVSMFPCWSETFIAREIQVLLSEGVDVRILSLRPWQEAFQQDDAAVLLDRVIYPPGWGRCLIASLRALLVRPRQSLVYPYAMLSSLWRKPLELGKSLAVWVRTQGILAEMRDTPPDHIHAHWATYPSTAAMMLADEFACSFSFTAHAHDIFVHDHFLERKLRKAAFAATISEFNRRLLRERYPGAGKASKIEIVHCGVLGNADGNPQGTREEGLIVSVGRLDEIKGFPVLLEACRLLGESGRNFRCEIVGDGPEKPVLQDLLEKHGLQRCVRFHGALPSAQVDALLRRASVFVLASRRAHDGNMDGIPVALMEAMAVGTPCISTLVSGIPELITDQVTGMLVPPDDAQSLARAVAELLDDPERAEAMAMAGREKIRREFDARSEALKLLSLFRQERNGSPSCVTVS